MPMTTTATARPPLLFLHGGFAGPEVWTRFFAPWFADRGHRVLVPRLAPPADGPARARLRDYVQAARAAASVFGEPPVVIGYSLGGLVAQHLAAERRVAGVVLVSSPGPLGLTPSLWHLSLAHRPVLAALMLTQAGAGQLLGVEAVRRVLFTPETPAEWIADVGLTPVPESPLALLDGMAWDLPCWPMSFGTPVLALLGDRDAFVPVSDLWGLQMAYGAEVEVLRGMGHGVPIDPHWRSVAWRIAAWLDERRRGTIGR
jgi:pimeloyl-ACP methyl ester carboxylesterase